VVRADVVIVARNGAGASGLAGRTRDELISLGYGNTRSADGTALVQADGERPDRIEHSVEVGSGRHGQLGGDLELPAAILARQVGDGAETRDARC
jgi:hypothetical protein